MLGAWCGCTLAGWPEQRPTVLFIVREDALQFAAHQVGPARNKGAAPSSGQPSLPAGTVVLATALPQCSADTVSECGPAHFQRPALTEAGQLG